MRIVSIGEVLWDVITAAEHLGGAPLNLAVHATRLGHEVLLVSAVGDDDRGRRALAKMRGLGLAIDFIQRVGDQPTGSATVGLDAGGQPHFTIHRPAAYDFVELSEYDLERLTSPTPDWICHGTLFQSTSRGRAVTEEVLSRSPGARCFYDVNLRTDSCPPSFLHELLLRADVVKCNEREACAIGRCFGWNPTSLEQFCRICAEEFVLEGICVTLEARGCALLVGREYVEVDGFQIQVADPVGAGDAFSAALLHGLHRGWSAAAIGEFANRVGAIVASRHGAVPPWTLEEVAGLTRR